MKYEADTILEKLEKNSDGKYILKLIEPIKWGEDSITEFELAPLKAKHIRSLPAEPKVDDMLKVVADVAARPDAVIDELSLKDVNNLTAYVEAFN